MLFFSVFFLAVCWASGQGHYSTFDGKKFSAFGNCRTLLVGALNGEFSIFVRPVKCDWFDTVCSRRIEIKIGNIFIDLISAEKIEINKVKMSSFSYSVANLTMRKAGIFLHIFSDIGLTVQWDLGK